MTDLTDDQTALREFVRNGSEAAFDSVVRRHADWVYSAALRQVHDPAAAEDVAQAAFILLARKAPQLTQETHLSGWLFKVVGYEAKFVLRFRRRRHAHEQAAAVARSQSVTTAGPASDWEEISPVLDAAVAKLAETDRQCILLRFYEQMSFAGVGAALNTSEEAARKRVGRAIAKLRHLLTRHGVESPPSNLSALLLGGGLVHPAPIAINSAAARAGHAAGSSALKLAAHANRALNFARLKVAAWLLGAAGLLTGAVAAHSVLLADTAPPPVVQPAPAAAAQAAPQPPPPAAAVAAAPVAPTMTTDTFLGRIIDPSGHPVPNATIWPVDDHIQPTDRSDNKFGLPTQSAADGTFALTVTQPDPGQYAPTVGVVVHADKFAWTGGRLAGPRPVDIELPLPIGLRAVFVDPDGSPVQGLAVDVEGIKSSDDEIDTLVRLNADFSDKFRRVTDAAGVAEWTDLPRLYSVNFNWTDPRFAGPTGDATTYLPDALGAPDMTIQLKAASTIRGRITFGPTHQPAAQVRVRTFGEAKIENGRTIVNATATTDSDGNYALTQLLPANYTIFLDNVQPDQTLPRNWTTQVIAATVGQGQTLDAPDLVLQKGAVITGTVTDAATGAPLKGAYLEVTGQAQPLVSTPDRTDAAGQFILRVMPGKQKLIFASGPQYYALSGGSVMQDLAVADGQTVTLDFQMKHIQPTSTEYGHGTVVFADGTPAPGARLIYECADGHREFTRTDRDGHFPFTSTDSPDGHFSLWASLGLLRSHPVTDTARGEFRLILLPGTTLPLTGRVVDENGQPIEGAVVIARKMPLAQSGGMGFTDAGTRSTGPDGTFQFQRLSPDWDYRIETNAPGHRRMSKTVRARNNEFAPLEFKMQVAAPPANAR